MNVARLSLATILLLCCGISAKPQEDHFSVSCAAKNQQIVVYDQHRKKTYDGDDWIVDCTIKIGGNQIFADTLPLGHPAQFSDAMVAIQEFTTKKAKEIVKQRENKGKADDQQASR